nr:retrovirus-related Pol polyprotein from transposon TNT 1-94 [Tanacetum cinerariifolium]
MMNLTTLPKSFWGYALKSIALLNMVLTKKVERTPYEIWHEKAPKLSYLRVWGCEALVKRDAPDKHDPRSIKCIFVGYLKETMGFYFYYPLKNKIFVARNAEFVENNLMVQEASGSHVLLKSSGSDGGLELIQEEDTQSSENTREIHNEVIPIKVKPQNVEVCIHRSVRISQALDRYGFYVDVEEYELGDLNEPPNYKSKCLCRENPKDVLDGKLQEGVYSINRKADYRKSQGAKTPSESDKRSTTTMSSTEAEYIAATEASMKAVRMRKFIDGLRSVVPSNKRPMEMLCDNEPSIDMANDLGILKGVRYF